MASEKWSNPTVCLVPMSWPTEYARHLDVRTTSIYPLPKMSPDRALGRLGARDVDLVGYDPARPEAGGVARGKGAGHHEKCPTAFAAERAGEGALVGLDAVLDLAALCHPHAGVATRVGEPHAPFSVEADAVGGH